MKQAKTGRSGALRRLLAAALLAAMAAAASAASDVVYPQAPSALDSRYDYGWEVLRMALEKTRGRYGPYTMRETASGMSHARVTQEMLTPKGRVNLFARTTTIELEQQFLPIRFPFDRGLLGYRVLLVRETDLARFAAVRTLDELRKLRAGQGQGWADIAILRAAGVPVVEGGTYDGLFPMLSAGRFDFFSRSADEALREYAERHADHPELAVEPTLLLHYPLPRYFFVRRDAEGRKLGARIEAGLEAMLRDGSLNTLFYRHMGATIQRADFRRRRMLQLPNPSLPPQTPLARRELWYDPFSGK
jgi:ABC-type amino acid transport substrate-binding protein